MRIMLISGHGAGDPGCVANLNGVTYREAEETRKVVALLETLLESYATVGVYDQSRDAFKDAQADRLGAKLKGWDYVLEIHFNACVKDYHGDGKTTGCEIFYPSISRTSGAESLIISEVSALGLKNRGTEAGKFSVINTAARQGCKANLFEVCFLDDADDMKIYTGNRQRVAKAIADGVIKAFGLEEDSEMFDVNKLTDADVTALWAKLMKPFSDNDEASWAETAGKWGIAQGLISGGAKLPDGSPNYMWEKPVNRQELMVMLYQLTQYLLSEMKKLK